MRVFKVTLLAVIALLGVCLVGVVAASGMGQLQNGDILIAGVYASRGGMAFHMMDTTTDVRLIQRPRVAWRQDFSFSPDGKQVLIFSASSNFEVQSFHVYDFWRQREIYTEPMPGQEAGDIFILRRFQDYLTLWSPDNTKIAFRDPGGDGLYIMDLVLRQTRKVYEGGLAWLDGAAWSQDSQNITFTANGDVFVVGHNGSDLMNLSAGLHTAHVPRWSPDGEEVVFFEVQEETRSLYSYMASPDGTVVENLSEQFGEGYDAQWSPDGEWLLFFSGRVGVREVYTVYLPDRTVYRLNSDPDVDLSDVDTVRWSPDGAYIAVELHQPGSLSGGMIYVVQPDGQNLQLITEDGVRPVWSPDGQYLVYTVRIGEGRSHREELYVTPVSVPARPQRIARNGYNAVWSDEGRYITLVDYPTRTESHLVRFHPTTNTREVLLKVDHLIVDFVHWRE